MANLFADFWPLVIPILVLIGGLAWLIALLERDHAEAEEKEKDWWPK